MTDELKETIIREDLDGIWLVLAEENPPYVVTADDPALPQAADGDNPLYPAQEQINPFALPRGPAHQLGNFSEPDL